DAAAGVVNGILYVVGGDDTARNLNEAFAPLCGNGTLDASEECDDGNTASGDGCSHDCQLEQCYTCSGSPSRCGPSPSGTACEDGNRCTLMDQCDERGRCVGFNFVCAPVDRCHEAGTCDPPTGLCREGEPKVCMPDKCHVTVTCDPSTGQCIQSGAIVCKAIDTCHLAGTCDPSSGCSNPPRPSGTSCDDGDNCTAGDQC